MLGLKRILFMVLILFAIVHLVRWAIVCPSMSWLLICPILLKKKRTVEARFSQQLPQASQAPAVVVLSHIGTILYLLIGRDADHDQWSLSVNLGDPDPAANSASAGHLFRFVDLASFHWKQVACQWLMQSMLVQEGASCNFCCGKRLSLWALHHQIRSCRCIGVQWFGVM